jgi:primosomal protein N' (replication factor Y) (superfamily II helicase)
MASQDFLFDLPSRHPDAAEQETFAALVLIDGGGDQQFDYAIPEALLAQVEEGSRVRVPLQNRQATGTVMQVRPASEAPFKRLRALQGVIEEKPSLTPKLLELGRWIAEYYGASFDSVMRAMLPETVRSNKHQAREVKFVRMLRSATDEEWTALQKRSAKQADVITQLQESEIPLQLAHLNAAAVKGLLHKFKEAPLIAVEDGQLERDPYADDEFIATSPLALNNEQQGVMKIILEAVQHPEQAKPILLLGVTGSGKTEVYLQAAQRVLDLGKSVLVLVPEISLTPQTVDRFKSRFSHMQKQVAVLHSQLSQGERFDEWHKISKRQCRIVIGARSAIFAPLENLGLILVDEEHENSYKQDQPPRYQGRDVAVVRAKLEGCPIVLGSATPSLESYYNTQRGKYQLVEMKERADDCTLPLVRIIDMKLEGRKGKHGNAPAIISERLRMGIDLRLAKGEQTILFLNRRGYSKSVQCQACGHIVMCQHCSTALRMHQSEKVLICHICGYRKKPPRSCPECSDPAIFFSGFGTERVEETLAKLFPKARIARVDADSMQQKHKLRDTLNAFKAQKLDLLIGTQMIAKGLHFPNVTLVGILNADLALHVPDFRAGERTFQLLTQVAGRAGRGEMAGEVIVQTFTPQSPSIQFARHHDFHGFAAQELQMRQDCGHPPYGHAVLLTVRSEQQDLAKFSIETLAEKLVAQLPKAILMADPNPSPLERSHNQWRYQILFRARTATEILRYLQPILAKERPKGSVILTLDVDPVDLM